MGLKLSGAEGGRGASAELAGGGEDPGLPGAGQRLQRGGAAPEAGTGGQRARIDGAGAIGSGTRHGLRRHGFAQGKTGRDVAAIVGAGQQPRLRRVLRPGLEARGIIWEEAG